MTQVNVTKNAEAKTFSEIVYGEWFSWPGETNVYIRIDPATDDLWDVNNSEKITASSVGIDSRSDLQVADAVSVAVSED